MIGRRDQVDAALDAIERRRFDPLAHTRWTTPQLAFLQWPVRKGVWRGGNSIGKTFAHAFHIIHTARGTHPYRSYPWKPPLSMVLAGYSWEQMDPLCETLYAMLPKHEIDPKLRYEKGQGIRGMKYPVIEFIRGPGAGSVIKLGTYEQGAKGIMGSQRHYFGMDEPPPSTLWGEVQPRLNNFRGELRCTFTPTPESPPLGYLREKVKKGKLNELQTTLNLDAVTIRGGLIDYPRMSEAEIEETLADYLEDELPMRRDGAWDIVAVDRWLTAFTEAGIVDEIPDLGWHVAVGIDHGAGPGRQYACLLLAEANAPTDGLIILADEAWDEDVTSTDEDGRNILDMLARNGIAWDDVDVWRGDRKHSGDFYGNAKENRDIEHAICRHIGVHPSRAKRQGLSIVVPKKYHGSMRYGFRLMNSLAKKGRFKVHRRCERFREGARRWAGVLLDPLKDPLDGARYATEALNELQVVQNVWAGDQAWAA